MTKRKPATKPRGIDPRSTKPILSYREERGAVPGVPARDLTGTDLARIAYKRRLVTDAVRSRPEPLSTPTAAAKIADELVATGSYRWAEPMPEGEAPQSTTTITDTKPADESATKPEG